jgi:hypothetical protein
MGGEGNGNRRLEPFFAYSFYTFEYTSPTVTVGSNSRTFEFNSQRTFEVEKNKDFDNYLQKETLKIELIDESIELNGEDIRDYIGTVRIPLVQLLKHGEINSQRFNVLDNLSQDNRVVGDLIVSIKVFDNSVEDYADRML